MTTGPSIAFGMDAPSDLFDQVVALGDRNSRTLGFLPYAGFRAAASEDRIAIALADERTVIGYCLFDLPRNVVRIVHVCVSEEARGNNLAETLVDAVAVRHAERLGLVLKCRADWPADKMWPKLGFIAQGQVPGRSMEQHPLTIWWRSLGHPDLFSLLEEDRSAGRSAAIDSNVYCDLHSATRRPGARQSAAIAPLVADGELNIVLLRSVDEEIYSTRNSDERARFLNAKLNYAKGAGVFDREVADRLLADAPKRALAKDPSLRRDAELIAEAFANGIDVFITRDQGAIQYLAEPAANLGVEVLAPTEVPTFLNVEQSHSSYRPAQLAQTTFSIQRLARPLNPDETRRLLDRAGGERLTELRQLLADLAVRSTSDVVRNVVFDGDSNVCAVWASYEAAALDVPLFRIQESPLQTTIAAQVIQLLRQQANRTGREMLRITDPHVGKAVRRTLEGDGFYAETGALVALSLPIIGPWDHISVAARSAAATQDGEALLWRLDLPESPSPAQAAEFERIWAPTRIVGQGLRTYLVPIKRPFASQLLGYPASLMNRPDDLGLSREHVYYCSRSGPVKSPARILWYVSGKVAPGVIGCSSLAEVRVDTPRRLHRLYSRLGVWSVEDVAGVATQGRAAALRFTNTELFDHPVGLDRIRALAPEGQSLLLRSAHELDDVWFERIYREGVRG